MRISSSAFDHRSAIPRRHSKEGDDVSPPLAWSGVPEGAKELALVVDDPDAPRAEPFVHWVLHGLPAATSGLREGESGGGTEGRNDFGDVGWGGPMPPPGHGTHHYRFRLHALSEPSGLGPAATKAELMARIESITIARAEVVGTYERR